MRTVALSLATLLGLAGPLAADDKARALVEKAIQAHGGEARIAKLRAMRFQAEGTMEVVPGQPAVPFTTEDVWQVPDRYRYTTVVTVMGQAATWASAIDGDRGWVAVDEDVRDMTPAAVAERREQLYSAGRDRLGFLADKGVELSLLDEIPVAGKPAVGVLVKARGHRDVKLYFDKATGLLVRREHAVRDPDAGEEVTQVMEFGDHADTDGVQHYKTVTVYRGGRQFMTAKVTRVEFLDKVDPKLFAKP